MRKEDATLEEVFECLKAGGRAFIGGDRAEVWTEVELEDTHSLRFNLRFRLSGEVARITSTNIGPVWTIETKELGYYDITPQLKHTGCYIVHAPAEGGGNAGMMLSDCISHKDFLGYVWGNPDREGVLNDREGVLNDCPVMWRKKSGQLYRSTEPGVPKEICKAVRFKKEVK